MKKQLNITAAPLKRLTDTSCFIFTKTEIFKGSQGPDGKMVLADTFHSL